MKPVITEAQKRIIEQLAKDGHRDALVAFGGDLYRKGLINGAVLAAVGIAVGKGIEVGVKGLGTLYKNRKAKKQEEQVEES